MKKPAVILLSGGLDSTTCAAIADDAGYEMHGITINYGQRHDYELEASKLVAKQFKFKSHAIIELDLASFGGSSLVSDKIEIPKNRDLTHFDDIPVTYVPARNTVFLSLALAWAETLDANNIFIGVNALDYSGYPDCRPEYIESFEKTANLATKAGVLGKKFKIHTPLINMTKAEIINSGLQLGVDYSMTSSCYDPKKDGAPCSECDACTLRLKGFEEALANDPLNYR